MSTLPSQTPKTRHAELVSASQKAFTLAEILITLAIIGVVAALTIPTVVINYQKQQTAIKLKKNFNILTTALNQAQAENGFDWRSESVETVEQRDKFAQDYFLKYLKISKMCKEDHENCWAKDVKYLNGTHVESLSAGSLSAYYRALILNDGTFMAYRRTSVHIQIYVDLNGFKAPNTIGKDIFPIIYDVSEFKIPRVYLPIYLNVGRVDPHESIDISALTDSSSRYNCNSTSRGQNCGALIQRNGWKVPDDYPW